LLLVDNYRACKYSWEMENRLKSLVIVRTNIIIYLNSHLFILNLAKKLFLK